MEPIYRAVAARLAEKINAAFESEESLKRFFESRLPGLPFDRTNHWMGLIYSILRDAWMEAGPAVKAEPTGYDKLKILQHIHPLLDYNLFTQVLLNLQGYTGMAYMTGDAEKEIVRIKDAWPKDAKLNPFEPKAEQIKTAVTEEDRMYNNTLSTLRSLRLISQFTRKFLFGSALKARRPHFQIVTTCPCWARAPTST